ncbi:MAG: hypothetical protein PHC54_05495 [Candidatus Omnitrophica bacterium]|nr:hypothetical protein [Candidatus Omnitrophota bacterium]MDD5592645.1 hypothetical protein [Candidatus Omnitrophota bacterium]
MENFPYSPDFGARCKPRYNTESTKFENETEETRLITSKKLRTWQDLPFSSRDAAEMAAVNTFFDTVKEDLEEFTITIYGESVTGKIEKDSFWCVRIGSVVYNYGFTFREVP